MDVLEEREREGGEKNILLKVNFPFKILFETNQIKLNPNQKKKKN